ncbi:bifunctional DNA primase/polymerase [Streptomyces sp. ISL-43]|uniref:bifunctional DNA primase/polymerase n=1 Tax=Streptomyces sp. ISL-43 TaxID=2819183 RepID=UPI001BEA65A3|nr:bifunctional DNA primase/polymerase [Streptomyces sp. ISL-43]MBT2450935.1 bifunctional DNA primase/polymerase [Streptomyces sp. ISL-43]
MTTHAIDPQAVAETPLAGALWLAQRQFKVFAADHPGAERCAGIGQGHNPATCTDRGKHPAEPFTKTPLRDEQEVRRLFSGPPRNVGVYVGGCSGPNGEQLLVMDSDRPGALEDTAKGLGYEHTPTMRVHTAKGHHDYYWAPAEAKLGNGLGALKGKFDGDVRAGNAYVIALGSVHATGVVYTLENPDQPPVAAPAWLLEALQARASAPAGPTTDIVIPADRHDVYTRKVVQAECDAITRAANGEQNTAINTAAFSLGTLVGAGALTEGEAREDLLAAARAGNHPEGRALATIESGLRAGMAQPRQPWPPVARADARNDFTGLLVPEPRDETPPQHDRTRTSFTLREPEPEPAEEPPGAAVTSFKRGGAFFHDVPATPPAVWGAGGDVLWAEGEALLIAAPQGVGKTTLAHQLIRARLGLQQNVLGFPVAPGKVVLLLAMDRPSQTRRAGARIFGRDDPAYLNDHLVVWEGPPPFDLAKRPEILAAMCEKAKADTVVIDSIKDAAIGLSDDAVGAGYNRARQKALAEGVQVLENHHVIKRGPNGAAPNTMADIYGSTWITSGAGSVVLLWGEAGDPLVSFRHLKQPMDEVGPFHLVHDHEAGTTDVQHAADLLDMARRGGVHGVTAMAAAEAIFETKKVTPAQREKARRKLDKLTRSGHLTRVDSQTAGEPARYYLGRADLA